MFSQKFPYKFLAEKCYMSCCIFFLMETDEILKKFLFEKNGDFKKSSKS